MVGCGLELVGRNTSKDFSVINYLSPSGLKSPILQSLISDSLLVLNFCATILRHAILTRHFRANNAKNG